MPRTWNGTPPIGSVSSPRRANSSATGRWSSARMFTANVPASWIGSCIEASRVTQISTSNGSSETDVKEFAVIARYSPPSFTVTTVTPVPKRPTRFRYDRVSILGSLVMARILTALAAGPACAPRYDACTIAGPQPGGVVRIPWTTPVVPYS